MRLLTGLQSSRVDSATAERAERRVRQLVDAHGFEDVAAQLLMVDAERAAIDDRLEEAIEKSREAHERFARLRLIRDAADAIWWAANWRMFSGNLDAGEAALEQSLAYAREVRVRYFEDNSAINLAGAMLLRCDFERFASLAEALPSSFSFVVAQMHASRAELAGDLQGALALLPSPDAAAGVPIWLAFVHGVAARTLFNAGDEGAAREAFARCVEALEGAFPPGEPAFGRRAAATLSLLDDCLPALADDAAARTAYETLVALSAWRAGLIGRAFGHMRGDLALRLDRVDEAEVHYRTGLEWAERERCPVEAGRNHQGLAEVAARRDDREAAREHLDAALELFQQHGAKLYLDQVIAKKLELQGAGSTYSGATIDVLTRSVGAERPDLATQTAPDGTVTLLFSDIEGSTALNVELGDDAYMGLLDEHNRLVRAAIAEHKGYEVKTEGDAFMVAFGSARDALRCALDIQRALAERNNKAERAIRVRIGLHTGEPVKQGDDFYGTHVVMASRIASRAEGGEVLISSLLHELVAASGEFALAAREPAALKGLDGEHVTYAVRWA